MFSEKDLIERSVADMSREVDDLLAESKRLREEHDAALQKEEELRRESVETRPTNAELAEAFWQEPKGCMKMVGRCCVSMEKKLPAEISIA
jgi:septation ring formation regulator EzrA